MLLRAAISFLLLGPVFSASCLAGQSFIQEEGKYLNPPNLIWTENSVFAGVSLASVPRLPFSASSIARITLLPLMATSREAGAYPIGFRSSQRIQLKQPRVGKRLPAIETKVEELPEEVIDHMRLRHGRFLTIFPARASWNEKPDRTKLDYWFSQEIQSFILIQQVGPGDSSHSVKVFDIRRHEPDAALFSIPEGYKIEEMVISDPRPQYIL
jgi:hypothetical protein